MRMRLRGLTLLPLLWAADAFGDTTEGSVRPLVEARWASIRTPTGRGKSGSAAGLGLILGYGLDFSWTATLRYTYDWTGIHGVPGEEYRQVRHVGAFGVAWAPS